MVGDAGDPAPTRDDAELEGEDVILDEGDLGPATEKGAVDPVSPQPFDKVEHDTKARLRITQWLMAVLTGVLLLALIAWFVGKPTNEVVDVATKLLAPVSGLLGAAIGFYFASKENSS